MRPAAHAVHVDLEVPFHDVDAVRIVWHGHYLKYFEIARTALLRSVGLDVQQVLDMGYAMLVMESRVRHVYPLHYADRFRVTAWCVDWDVRLHIAYELHNLTHGRRAARGHTKLVTLGRDGQLLYETPPEIVARFA